MSEPPTDGSSTQASGSAPPDPGELAPTVDAPTSNLDLTTGTAPTFAVPITRLDAPAMPQPGERVDDFEIISVLGRGAFACVYLARQVSLDRQVALKVSANRGTEARTLASLEHEHIVRVFSEVIDRQANRRLLCMQFVNGSTLERVLRVLAKRPPAEWSGRAILEAIDEMSSQPALFDPAALRNRELLWNADYITAVCWIGARLAEALAHAHSQGVLHRDIKPANILLNRYGRPMLADFNIAFDPRPAQGGARTPFGGTLGYMAPEHLDAFNPAENTPPEAVERRSDIYSLGVVLFEMLTGRLPFPLPTTVRTNTEELRRLAEERRGGAPAVGQERPVPESLDRLVQRCLRPRPEDRYPSADELARALDGCREQCEAEKALPRAGPLTRTLLRHPFSVGLLLLLLPHLIGSAVNIAYNKLCIVEQMGPIQLDAFKHLVLGYNLLAYPLGLLVTVVVAAPIWRCWKRLTAMEPMDLAIVAACRQRLLAVPGWVIVLSAAGWLPGGLLFPLGLYCLTGECDASVFHHFLVSFTISGLIALTYSVFVAEYLVLRVLYPRWRLDGQEFRQRAQTELRPLARRLWILQLLAGLIPLTGAVLMVGVGPEEIATDYQGFRVLVTLLIALGMLGFGVAVTLSGRLSQTVAAMTGGEPRGQRSPPGET
jgi:serine/threonine protein kinase